MGLFVSNRHQLVVERAMVLIIVRVGAAQCLQLCINIGSMLHRLCAATPQRLVVPLNNRLPTLGYVGIPRTGMRCEGEGSHPQDALNGTRYGSRRVPWAG